MKNENPKSLLLLFLLVFSSLSFAFSSSYETASVSRIVGDSPNELFKSLSFDEVNLAHSTIFSKIKKGNVEETALSKVFESDFADSLSNWDWSEVEDSMSSWKENVLFLLNARGVFEDGK